MRLPASAPRPPPTLGLGSLHDIIVRFGVHEVLGGFLHRGPRTRACTNCTCARAAAAAAAAAASSFGRRRLVLWPPAPLGPGQTAGRRRRWDWSWRRRARPRRGEDASSETQHFLGFARLTTIGIQVVNKVRDGCSTPRLLLLSVRAFTDARRQTQLLEVHGVLEDGHPPRVHRILHIRVFER